MTDRSKIEVNPAWSTLEMEKYHFMISHVIEQPELGIVCSIRNPRDPDGDVTFIISCNREYYDATSALFDFIRDNLKECNFRLSETDSGMPLQLMN